MIVITCCIILICAIALFGISISQQAFAQSSGDDLWYYGKGIKPDTYLKYKIQDTNVNNGNPYEMIIYFDHYDNNTGYWVAPIFVITNGTVLNDTFHIDTTKQFWNVFFGNTVSPEIKPYKDEFYTHILSLWLAATEPGSSLNAREWIPYPEFHAALNGTQKITVLAGTFNCTEVLTGSPSQIDKTWINKDLPYPVKGSGYELEEIGHGYPTVPEFQSAQNNSSLPSPLKQFKAGTPASSVKCTGDLQLVIKSEDGSPACVMPDTGKILVERGWARA